MKPYNVFRYGEDITVGAIDVLNISANRGISTIAGSTVQATVSVTLNSDGTITYIGNGTPGSWHTDPAPGLGSSFWAIITLGSGTIGTGTIGSRVSLATGQTWTKTTDGTASIRTAGVAGTIQIWDAASGGNKVSEGNFTITANVQATATIGGATNNGGIISDSNFAFDEGVPLNPV